MKSHLILPEPGKNQARFCLAHDSFIAKKESKEKPFKTVCNTLYQKVLPCVLYTIGMLSKESTLL